MANLIDKYNVNGTEYNFFDSNKITKVTYSELIELRNRGELIPGQKYRITDYTIYNTGDLYDVIQDFANCTESREIRFDIIVEALTPNTLSENSRAAENESISVDWNSVLGYVPQLESYELKYCLDNDTSRFNWAEPDVASTPYFSISEFDEKVTNGSTKAVRFYRNPSIDKYPDDPSASSNGYNYIFGWSGSVIRANYQYFLFKSDYPEDDPEDIDWAEFYYYIGEVTFNGRNLYLWKKYEGNPNNAEEIPDSISDCIETEFGILTEKLYEPGDLSEDNYEFPLYYAKLDGDDEIDQEYLSEKIGIERLVYVEVNVPDDLDYTSDYVTILEKDKFTAYTDGFDIPSNFNAQINVYGELMYFNDGDSVYTSSDTISNYIGKGVIYEMKDDKGNTCPYDFINLNTFSTNNDEFYAGVVIKGPRSSLPDISFQNGNFMGLVVGYDCSHLVISGDDFLNGAVYKDVEISGINGTSSTPTNLTIDESNSTYLDDGN